MTPFCRSFPLIAMVALSGCAGSLTVNSVPQGALISSNKQALGQAPLVITLTKDSARGFPLGANGCYMAPGFTAQWASGAEASSPENTALCDGIDADYTVNLARPANAPGLDKDLKVANERENVLAQQAQAQAINNVAGAIELNTMGGPGMGYGPYGYGGWGY
ncbi:MAG: hypothetical protein RL651_1516 [Pseudomonadota bacterium]